MHHKIDEGFGCFRFGAPIATRDFEEAGGVDDVVAEANDGGCRRCVVSCSGEAYAVIELREELVDGRWRMPWSCHSECIGVEFDLGDGSPGCPKMREDLETSDAAESKFGVGEFTEVVGGDGEEDLVTESFVGFLVGPKRELVVVENAVDFGDLCRGGGCWMDRVDGAVDGGCEGNATRNKEVCGGKEGESKMAVDSVAGVGRNSSGVGVELGLGCADGGIRWGRCDGGNGRDDGVRERGRDGGCGEGGGFLHGRNEI